MVMRYMTMSCFKPFSSSRFDALDAAELFYLRKELLRLDLKFTKYVFHVSTFG